jgi:hypothetical protein
VPLDAQDTRLWDRMMIIEAEGLLTAAARARQFGRYQCEAAIQSVHVGRAVTGSVDRNALLTLYDLLVTQTESVGARIARAVLLADAGDPQAGIAAIEALDPARIAGHQPYWVARSAILERLGRRHAAAAALAKAKTLTGDPAVPGPSGGSPQGAGRRRPLTARGPAHVIPSSGGPMAMILGGRAGRRGAARGERSFPMIVGIMSELIESDRWFSSPTRMAPSFPENSAGQDFPENPARRAGRGALPCDRTRPDFPLVQHQACSIHSGRIGGRAGREAARRNAPSSVRLGISPGRRATG